MYRPNRIGPYAVKDTAHTPWDLTTWSFGSAHYDTIYPTLQNTTVPSEFNGFTVAPSVATTMAGATLHTIGTVVDGTVSVSERIIFSVSGSLSIISNLVATPFIGLLDSGTLVADPSAANNACSDYIPLPVMVHDNYTRTVASVQTSVVLQIPVDNVIPVCAGWIINNPSGSAANTKGVISMNLHKFASDLETMDTSR